MLKKIKEHPRIAIGLLLLLVLLVSSSTAFLLKLRTDTAQAKSASDTVERIRTVADQKAAASTQKAAAEEAKKQEQAKAAEAAKLQAATTTAPQPTYVPASLPSPKGKSLYVNPALAHAGRPAAIASQPTATWFGAWTGNVTVAAGSLVGAASAQGSLAVIVVYNIPARDCGGYSAGGAGSSADYRAWVRGIAAGIGKRQAIVVLEPDALAHITCLNAANQEARYADLADAVTVFATQTNASVYIDAGHSNWIDAGTMAYRLQRANIAQARGFALNVSNFQTTASSISYGNAIASKTSKSYVVDTSRNGRGSNGEWCNPRGRALGERPTTMTPGYADAYLWIKMPGESDGECNGGPAAGVWWEEYARELVTNAG